jgi:hypothetical protein
MGVGIMKNEVTRKTCLNCGHEFTYRERLQSSLFVIPILPLKWDPKDEAETPAAEKHPS